MCFQHMEGERSMADDICRHNISFDYKNCPCFISIFRLQELPLFFRFIECRVLSGQVQDGPAPLLFPDDFMGTRGISQFSEDGIHRAAPNRGAHVCPRECGFLPLRNKSASEDRLTRLVCGGLGKPPSFGLA